MLMLLMCWASQSSAQATRASESLAEPARIFIKNNKVYDRVVFGGATWPGHIAEFEKLGKIACGRLYNKGWSYESECKVTKIIQYPKLGEFKHISNDDYQYIPNGKLGHDKFVVLVENTEGRKAIATMLMEVYEETGMLNPGVSFDYAFINNQSMGSTQTPFIFRPNVVFI